VEVSHRTPARRLTAGAPPRFTHPPPHLPPRAISSPKVTRRFCRLPLAIFWDLAKESSSRRPAAVMRTATKHLEGAQKDARRPASFPGRKSQASTAQKGAPLAAGQRRASPIKSIPHVALVKQPLKQNRKLCGCGSHSAWLPSSSPSPSSSGAGTLTRFPFGPARGALRLLAPFLPLGPTHPRRNALPAEPFSS